MLCDSSIGLLMDSLIMAMASFVLPWRNLYGGPLMPCTSIDFVILIGSHHTLRRNLWRLITIRPRTESKRILIAMFLYFWMLLGGYRYLFIQSLTYIFLVLISLPNHFLSILCHLSFYKSFSTRIIFCQIGICWGKNRDARSCLICLPQFKFVHTVFLHKCPSI